MVERPRPAPFGQARRLRRGRDFRRVLRKGWRIDSPLFTLWAAAGEPGVTRLGLSAGRRVGGAVARNRAKRLLRESFRRNQGAPGLDLVLVPKSRIVTRPQSEVDDEFRRSLRRLASRVPALPRGAGSPPAD